MHVERVMGTGLDKSPYCKICIPVTPEADRGEHRVHFKAIRMPAAPGQGYGVASGKNRKNPVCPGIAFRLVVIDPQCIRYRKLC